MELNVKHHIQAVKFSFIKQAHTKKIVNEKKIKVSTKAFDVPLKPKPLENMTFIEP